MAHEGTQPDITLADSIPERQPQLLHTQPGLVVVSASESSNMQPSSVAAKSKTMASSPDLMCIDADCCDMPSLMPHIEWPSTADLPTLVPRREEASIDDDDGDDDVRTEEEDADDMPPLMPFDNEDEDGAKGKEKATETTATQDTWRREVLSAYARTVSLRRAGDNSAAIDAMQHVIKTLTTRLAEVLSHATAGTTTQSSPPSNTLDSIMLQAGSHPPRATPTTLKRKRDHDHDDDDCEDDLLPDVSQASLERLIGTVHARMAALHWEQNNMHAAITHYRLAFQFKHDNPRSYVNAAQLMLLEGPDQDAKRAVTLLKTALELDPVSASVHCTLAAAYELLPEAAGMVVTEYQQALSIDPKFLPAHWRLANFYEKRLRDFVSAKVHYLRVVSLDPKHFMALANVGSLFQDAFDQPESARSYYQASLRVNPTQSKLLAKLALLQDKLGELDEARNCFKQATVVEPNDEKLWYKFAFWLDTRGKTVADYREARDCYLRSIQIFSHNYNVVVRLATLYLQKLRDEDAACKYFELAIVEAPDAVSRQQCESLLVSTYTKADNQDAITALYRKLVGLEPTEPNGHKRLALNLFQRKMCFDEARRHIKLALRLDPDAHLNWEQLQTIAGSSHDLLKVFVECCQPNLSDCWMDADVALRSLLVHDPFRAECHLRLGIIADDYRHDMLAAEAAYKHSLKLNPRLSPECYLRLALVHRRKGEDTEQSLTLHRGREAFPTHVQLMYEMAAQHHDDQMNEQALLLFTKVLRATQGTHADAHFYVGCIVEARRDYTAALEHFQQAIFYKQHHTEARLRAACILTQSMNRHQEAVHHFDAVLKLVPDHVAAHFLTGKIKHVHLQRYLEARDHYEHALKCNSSLNEVGSTDACTYSYHYVLITTTDSHVARDAPARPSEPASRCARASSKHPA